MPSRMAWRAEGQAVLWVVPKVGSFRPSLQVMCVESSAALAAVLACPVVSGHNRSPERLVVGVREVGLSRRRVASLPVGMCRPDEVRVLRWDAAGKTDAGADRRAVFCGEFSATESPTDVLPLRIGEHSSSGGRLASPGRADLRTGTFRFGRVRGQIAPGRRAGVRAEPLTSASVLVSALLANPSRHKPKFTTEDRCS